MLSVLLLAAVHCSFHPAGEGHGHASPTLTAAEITEHRTPAGPGEHHHPQHDHNSACTSPGLTPQTQNTSQPTAAAPGVLILSSPYQPEALQLPPSPRRASRPHAPRSGRSTLTSTCRWRI